MEKRWWKEAVVYQVYPRSFKDSDGDGIGDIAGIIEKIDYLKGLGIDAVWLNPVYPSPNDDNGYDISDYRAIMDEFGSMDDFDELLSRLHENNIRLIMDLVVNHSSDEHPWFIQSRSSVDNPYRDYYFWRPGTTAQPPNNWQSFFEGPAWDFDDKTGQWYLHLFSRKQPDLNWDNPAVRGEVRDIIRFWIDKRVDGFRMDVINLVSKHPGLPDGTDTRNLTGHEYFANGPAINEYLGFIQSSIENSEILTVGETIIADLDQVARYVDEETGPLDMAINFEHVGIDRGAGPFDPISLDLKKLKSCFSRWQYKLGGRGWNCLYMSNHDQPRQVSRYGDDGHYRRQSATMLATLLHTLQGTPFIMQGEELGMTNVAFSTIGEYRDVATMNYYHSQITAGEDPQEVLRRIHHCSRDNARTPVQWNSGNNGGFTTGTPWIALNPNYREINAEAQESDPDSVLNYYRRLIALRKEYPIIVYGSFEELAPEHPSVYAYRRRLGTQELIVVLDLGGNGCDLSFDTAVPAGKLLIANYEDTTIAGSKIELRPYEAGVIFVGE